MKILPIIILSILLSGCYSLSYVDAKGRDCKENLVFLYKWSDCDKTKEPLATTRQEIKVDANVNQSR